MMLCPFFNFGVDDDDKKKGKMKMTKKKKRTMDGRSREYRVCKNVFLDYRLIRRSGGSYKIIEETAILFPHLLFLFSTISN